MKGLCLRAAVFLSVLCVTAPGLLAQGLIWSVPESGTTVSYSGKYRQTIVRPDSAQGDLLLEWEQQLQIRCLERETASWNGNDVSCVWLEFEVGTGLLVDGQLDAGPGAVRIYKVLVPEQEILGKAFLELEVPRAYLPIVKGYRKIGEADVEELSGPVFQTFPVLSQVLINEHAVVAEQGEVQLESVTVNADRIDNSTVIEDAMSRTSNTTTIWVTDNAEVPFGSARWTVRVEREVKTLVDPREEFRKHSEISVEMQMKSVENEATSKLETP